MIPCREHGRKCQRSWSTDWGQFPKALHLWCASHQLNLVIVDSCILPLIRNMMGTTDQVGGLSVCVYIYNSINVCACINLILFVRCAFL